MWNVPDMSWPCVVLAAAFVLALCAPLLWWAFGRFLELVMWGYDAVVALRDDDQSGE